MGRLDQGLPQLGRKNAPLQRLVFAPPIRKRMLDGVKLNSYLNLNRLFVVPVPNERMWVWVLIGAHSDTGPAQLLEGDNSTVYVRILGHHVSPNVQSEPFRAKDVG
jgi:hypothetical protein